MWEGIELREIRVFLAVAEELHFGRAAARLRLTPSRVSQRLRELEVKLGGQLVQRTSRHVELTALGERFLEEVGVAHEQLTTVLARTYEGNRHLEGTLQLGLLTPAIEGPHLAAISRVFLEQHPEIKLEVTRAPFGDAFACLRRGEIDLLLSWLPHGQADLVTGPILTSEPRVLAVGEDHPLADRAEVTLEEIADFHTLAMEEVHPRELAETWVPRRTPRGRTIPRLEVPFGQMAREDPGQLRQQMSWWIRTGEIVYPTVASVHTVLGPGIAYVPISDMPPLDAALVWPRASQDPKASAFVRAAREVLVRV